MKYECGYNLKASAPAHGPVKTLHVLQFGNHCSRFLRCRPWKCHNGCIEIRVTAQTHSLIFDVYVMLQILCASLPMNSGQRVIKVKAKSTISCTAQPSFQITAHFKNLLNSGHTATKMQLKAQEI